ncbi:MAG: hypothetical protein NTU61_04825 [Candidatus Altiarchaeota archaeon]|nr:hypothetical protein [Candidatus Altiarchaeota archaeon]
MKSTSVIVFGVLLLLLPIVSAEGLIKTNCLNTLTSDFVYPMAASDINGDGVIELLVGTRVSGLVSAYKYKGYDCNNDWGSVQSGGWTYSTGGDVLSMYVGDLTNDKKIEIVANGVDPILNKNTNPMTKYAFVLTAKGTEDWNFKEQCGVSYTVYASDVDKSGTKNVILGTKSSKVCVLKDSVKTKEPVLWTYVTSRPVYAVRADDIDGDGSIEVLAIDKQGTYSAVYCLSSTGTLKWKYDIDGGIYTVNTNAERIFHVVDLDADGKKEVVIGTYNHGVDVLDSAGQLKWNYKTQGGSSPELVSVVLPYDVNMDGKLEVLVGAKPYLYSLSPTGALKWKVPVDTMIYGLAVGDVYGGSDNEIIVSSTRYIHVFTGQGSKIDSWAYKVEIQGRDVKFTEKDVNGYSVAVADLDGDGANEIAAAFGWQEDRDIVTYYYGDLRVFEVNKDFSPEAATETTLPSSSTTPTTLSDDIGDIDIEPPSTLPEGGGKGGLCCLPVLTALIAGAMSLLAAYPLK